MKEKLSQCWFNWHNAFALAMMNLLVPVAGAAPPSAASVMTDVRKFLGDTAEFLTWVVLIVAYLVAAYLIIDGGMKIATSREGGIQRFILGAVVAMVMVVLTTFMITTGQGEVDNIRG